MLDRISGRLASFLLELPREAGGTVTLPGERRFVAERLGMTPESLSRAFNVLRQHGLAGEGRRLVIADEFKLRAFERD